MLIPHPSRLYTADDGQEPPAGASPTPVDAGATPPAGTTTDAPPAGAEARTYSRAEYQEVQNEAKNLRTRLKKLEEAQAEAERAKLTEQERKDADLKSVMERLGIAERELQGYRLRDAIEQAVTPATLPQEGGEARPNDLHGISPKLAARLIDASALEVDEAGAIKPAPLRRALAALAAEYPEIRAQAQEAPPRPSLTPQRAAGQGRVRANPAAQFIESRYTALPPNVTKR